MKEEAGRPCADIHMPLYHQFDAPVCPSASIHKGDELKYWPSYLMQMGGLAHIHPIEI